MRKSCSNISIFLIFLISITLILLSQQALYHYSLSDRFIDNGSDPKNSLSNRPKLILHVGPPKTGTTSIQCGLAKYSGKLAQMDNYYYMGAPCQHNAQIYNITRQTGDTPRKVHNYLSSRVWSGKGLTPEAKKTFDEHHRQNHNIIISSETLSQFDEKMVSQLRNIFPPDKWDMEVIATYRRYYEWIPSLFYQKFEGVTFRRTTGITALPDYLRLRWEQYPNATIENIILKEHPTINIAFTYGKKFPVTLFDFHDGDGEDDLVTNFICNAIPDAYGTCDFIHKSKKKHVKARISQDKDLFYLQREIRERGLLKEGLDKTVYRKMIASNFHDMYGGSTKNPPQVCLTEEEEQLLWNISYASEKYIMMDNTTLFSRMISGKEKPSKPSLFSRLFLGKEKDKILYEIKLKNRHLDDFEDFKQRGKLCSIDLNKIIEDPEWKKIISINYTDDGMNRT